MVPYWDNVPIATNPLCKGAGKTFQIQVTDSQNGLLPLGRWDCKESTQKQMRMKVYGDFHMIFVLNLKFYLFLTNLN